MEYEQYNNHVALIVHTFSYAQVQRRLQEDKQLGEEQEAYVTELGEGDGALDRVFILIKTIHCVEQIIEKNQRVYWPVSHSFEKYARHLLIFLG